MIPSTARFGRLHTAPHRVGLGEAQTPKPWPLEGVLHGDLVALLRRPKIPAQTQAAHTTDDTIRKPFRAVKGRTTGPPSPNRGQSPWKTSLLGPLTIGRVVGGKKKKKRYLSRVACANSRMLVFLPAPQSISCSPFRASQGKPVASFRARQRTARSSDVACCTSRGVPTTRMCCFTCSGVAFCEFTLIGRLALVVLFVFPPSK